MNYKMIGRFLASIAVLEGALMVPVLGVSLGYGERATAGAVAISMGIMMAFAGIFGLMSRKSGKRFTATEGMVCAGLGWVTLAVLGALPFVISGEIPRFIDAFFEIVSGFTTTGSSILADVEALPRGLLLWRSISNWVGGMGVLVLVLAVLPSQGKGFTMHILRAESPGPDVGKLVPRMKNTALILYGIYVAMTVLNFIFLIAGKMPVFDAVCTAMSTAGTGGFGVKADSIGGFSPYIQWVTAIFMLLFGVNFSCWYLLLLGNVKSVLKDEEFRTYIGIFLAVTGLVVWNIWGVYDTAGETVRHAAFQVSSLVTSTGFATTDFDTWPMFSKTLLLVVMLVGASAGSTGGGFKVGRLLLVLKGLLRNIRQMLNPKKIQVVRNNGKAVSETVLDNANGFLAAYAVILVVSLALVSLDGLDMETNISAVITCFNNMGPGFSTVGPACNFLHLSDLSKLVLCFDMLAGRLEIFPMLVLFAPATWRRR